MSIIRNDAENLTLHSVENGLCRVYYLEGSKNGNRTLCYQESAGSSFTLYECTGEGEPSTSLNTDNYIKRTPLPAGDSSTEKGLRQWLVNHAIADISKKVNEYFAINGGMPTEFDMSINDMSRDIIRRIDEVYGKCYLIKLNLYGDERGNRDAICQEYQTGENYNAFNFCACFASPLINDDIVNLILQRDTSEYRGPQNDRVEVESIFKQLEALGAQNLHWA
tara:strand:- start:74919 stop:75584 length:666 start_codon:yes stop_codon:yes gene_type:complete